MKKTLKKKRTNCLYIILLMLYLVTKYVSKRKMVGGGRGAFKGFTEELQPIIEELYKLLKIGQYSMNECEEYHPYFYKKHRNERALKSLTTFKKSYEGKEKMIQDAIEIHLEVPYKKLKETIQYSGGDKIKNLIGFGLEDIFEGGISIDKTKSPGTIIDIIYTKIKEDLLNESELSSSVKTINEKVVALDAQLNRKTVDDSKLLLTQAEDLCGLINDYRGKERKFKRLLDAGNISDYFINLYEDLSGAVRVYIKLNEYSLLKTENKNRSYVQARNNFVKEDEGYMGMEKIPRIVLNNLCDYDMIYTRELKDKKFSKKIDGLKDKQEGSILELYNQIKQGAQKGEDYNKTDNTEEINMGEYGITDTYGDFYSVFDNEAENKDIYEGMNYEKGNKIKQLDSGSGYNTSTKGLKGALLQVSNGYNIIIFGYGYSGSGKTFTLLKGGKSDKQTPLIKNAYNDLKDRAKETDGKVFIASVYELYGILDYNKKQDQVTSQIRTLYKNEGREIKDGEILGDDDADKIQWDEDSDDLDTLLDQVEEKRKNILKTIKSTPNNPESSRSHLFIEIGYKKEKGSETTNYLTFVDMAGIENPFEIAISIFPFMDMRNKINPRLENDYLKNGCATKYKDITIEQLVDGEGSIPDKLYNHFESVLEHMYWGDQNIASYLYSNRFGLYDANEDWVEISKMNMQNEKEGISEELNQFGNFFWKPLKAPIQYNTYSHYQPLKMKAQNEKGWYTRLHEATGNLLTSLTDRQFNALKKCATYYNDEKNIVYFDYPVFATVIDREKPANRKGVKPKKALFTMKLVGANKNSNMNNVIKNEYLDTGIALSLLDNIKEIIYYGKGVSKIEGIDDTGILTENPEEKLKSIRSLLNKILNNIKIKNSGENLPNKYYYLKYLETFQIYNGDIYNKSDVEIEYIPQKIHSLGTTIATVRNEASIDYLKYKATVLKDNETTLQELYSLLYNYIYNSIILNGLYDEYTAVLYDSQYQTTNNFGTSVEKSLDLIIRGKNTVESGITELKFNYEPPRVYYYKKGENNYYKCVFKSEKSGQQWAISDEHEIIMVDYDEFEQLIKEGIFINETVNHITQYFQKKNDRHPSIVKDEDMNKEVMQELEINKNERYIYNKVTTGDINKSLDELYYLFKQLNNASRERFSDDTDWNTLNMMADDRTGIMKYIAVSKAYRDSQRYAGSTTDANENGNKWIKEKIMKIANNYGINMSDNEYNDNIITNDESFDIGSEESNVPILIEKSKRYFKTRDPSMIFFNEMKRTLQTDLTQYIPQKFTNTIIFDIFKKILTSKQKQRTKSKELYMEINIYERIIKYLEINVAIMSDKTLTVNYYTLWLNFYLSYKLLKDTPEIINLDYLRKVRDILKNLQGIYLKYANDESIYKELPNIENNIIAYPRNKPNNYTHKKSKFYIRGCTAYSGMEINLISYVGNYSNNVDFNLYSYMPKKSIFSTEVRDEGSYEKIKILKILDYYKSDEILTEDNRGTKYIMMCLVRPEIAQKFCTGTRATLDFAQAVCSTC